MTRTPKPANRLLALSLALNLLGLTFGGAYVYKTRSTLKAWIQKILPAEQEAAPPAAPRISGGERLFRQWMHAFRLLNETSSASGRVIVFAGDSLTATFDWPEYYDGRSDLRVLNRGIPGLNIERLTQGIREAVPDEPLPERVFLMIGINDVNRGGVDEEAVLEKYERLLDRLLERVPADRICVQSLLPVRNAVVPQGRIKRLNGHVKAFADARGLCYIDLYDAFADGNDQLEDEYTVDGIHLTSEGYRVWLRLIEPYVPQ